MLGYAVAPGSVETVSTGVAVPLRDGAAVVAALSVVVPRERSDIDAIVSLLRHAASQIGSALGEQRQHSH